MFKEPKPLVSICCLTYNHALYIRQCIDGFLMQKTSFLFEILIHDDASSDGTANIIREYAAKYDIIKPIYQTENQYSRNIDVNSTFNFSRALGKYIAMCEGDDYWIDPLKLQKQVDFMQAHPEFSICSGGYKSHKEGEYIDHILNLKNGNYTLIDFKKKWLTKTLTVLFRRSSLSSDFKELSQYRFLRDTHLFYHLLKVGKGHYFNDILGVYNIHSGGICSMISKSKNAINAYNVYYELYSYHKDEFTSYTYFNSILSRLRNGGYSSNQERKKLLTEAIEMIMLRKKYIDILRLLKVMIMKYIKIKN